MASVCNNAGITIMESEKIKYEADLLSVLAQPTRLRILYFLRDGERCACEINPSMPEDVSVISRHLVKMKNSGILDSRKEGVSIYYRIKSPQVFDIINIVDHILLSAAQEKAEKMNESINN